MGGVWCSGNSAGQDNASNVGNENLGGFEEPCRETEEDTNTCGSCCDEWLEVAIVKVEGNESKGWNGQG